MLDKLLDLEQQDARNIIEEAAALRCNTLKEGEATAGGVVVPRSGSEHQELVDIVPAVLSETGSPNATSMKKMIT